MEMEAVEKYIIFKPKTEEDFFTLGRMQERHKQFEYAILGDGTFAPFKISKYNLLKILIQESI